MKTEEIKFKEPDYKAIRELSSRIDCMVTQSDFSTSRPNPNRINSLVGALHRYSEYINRA